VSILLVFALAGARGNWVGTRLLLTGVVLASGWGAVVSLILVVAPAARLHGMLFWLMGDLSQAPLPVTASAVLLLIGLSSFALSSSLNLLAGGVLHAAALGVAVARVRVSVYLMASLATAVAVTQAGSIGFVGLLAPHLLRLCGATQHRLLLPAVILLGGTLLLLADTLARSLIAPSQLPVGSLTALLGVPLFLALLYRSRGHHDV
jgi:iron complex transport system permease protein